MSERSPSTYPSYKPDPVTAWMAVAGSGLIQRKATLELPMPPRTAPHVACHAAGRGPRYRARRGVAAADLAADRWAANGSCSRTRARSTQRSRGVDAAAPKCDRRVGPVGV